jgi:hypothetical protein
MAYIHPLEPQVITLAGKTTAGGTSYGTATFIPGMQLAQVELANATTGKLYFRLQLRNSTAGSWFSANAAASTVTSGTSVRRTSTATCVFNQVRVQTTAAQESTKAGAWTFVISAR